VLRPRLSAPSHQATHVSASFSTQSCAGSPPPQRPSRRAGALNQWPKHDGAKPQLTGNGIMAARTDTCLASAAHSRRIHHARAVAIVIERCAERLGGQAAASARYLNHASLPSTCTALVRKPAGLHNSRGSRRSALREAEVSSPANKQRLRHKESQRRVRPSSKPRSPEQLRQTAQQRHRALQAAPRARQRPTRGPGGAVE